MQTDDDNAAALKEAQVCVDIGNAMLAARNHDPVAAALGLLPLAVALVNNNPSGRTALAMQMIKLAQTLDGDSMSAQLQ